MTFARNPTEVLQTATGWVVWIGFFVPPILSFRGTPWARPNIPPKAAITAGSGGFLPLIPGRVVVFGLDRDWPIQKRLHDVYLVCRGLVSLGLILYQNAPSSSRGTIGPKRGHEILTWAELYVINRSFI